jgi:S-formylglutathione hydrolase FrmB
MEDIHFRSEALGREIEYRVILPATIPPATKLPVVWVLTGAGDNFQSWSNNSDIAELALHGIILVMPSGYSSYYVNAAMGSDKRFEDYIITEVIPDARRRFPAATTDREHNAVVGISRGGFGAAVLALKHPDMFSFVGSMSPSIDVAQRSFRWKGIATSSIGILRTFGRMNNPARKQNDPFHLVETPQARGNTPYFYLTCGDQESLFDPTQRFAAVLQSHNIPSESHTEPGGHNWELWTRQLPGLEASLLQYFGANTQKAKP